MNCEIGLQDVFKGDYRGTCENIVNKLIQVKSWKRFFINIFSPTLPPYDSLNKETLRPLGQINKITTRRSTKFSYKNSAFESRKHDKIVYNFFFGRLKVMLNQDLKDHA